MPNWGGVNQPILSIIIPVYGAENVLNACVDSALSQTLQNFELILVDDGGPDRSGEICDEYAAKDPRVRVIHQPNAGISTARNNGIAAARGLYITFMDDDDEYTDPRTLEDNIDILNNDPQIDFIQFPFLHFTHATNCKDFRAPAPRKICGTHDIETAYFKEEIDVLFWHKIFKREVFTELRFPDGKLSEDVFLIYDIIDAVKCVAISDKGCYVYNVRSGSTSQKKRPINEYFDSFESFLIFIERASKRDDHISKQYILKSLSSWAAHNAAVEHYGLKPFAKYNTLFLQYLPSIRNIFTIGSPIIRKSHLLLLSLIRLFGFRIAYIIYNPIKKLLS